jgi:uncharacterized damage-inducible protein DinB
VASSSALAAVAICGTSAGVILARYGTRYRRERRPVSVPQTSIWQSPATPSMSPVSGLPTSGSLRPVLRRAAAGWCCPLASPVVSLLGDRQRVGTRARPVLLAFDDLASAVYAAFWMWMNCRARVDPGRSGLLAYPMVANRATQWRDRPSPTSMIRVSEQPSRWSKATVYPDMWVDPDEDPRNSGGVSPDGELATLQDYLSDYRLTLRMKCEGLDAEQLARRSVPPSTMSLLGLLRHLAEVERDWRNWITSSDPLPKLYGEGDADFDGAVAEQTVVDAAYADLAHEQAATDAMLAEHPDLGERLGKDGIAVRELLVHRIDEYARHCGHADLLRECIDGRVGQ